MSCCGGGGGEDSGEDRTALLCTAHQPEPCDPSSQARYKERHKLPSVAQG